MLAPHGWGGCDLDPDLNRLKWKTPSLIEGYICNHPNRTKLDRPFRSKSDCPKEHAIGTRLLVINISQLGTDQWITISISHFVQLSCNSLDPLSLSISPHPLKKTVHMLPHWHANWPKLEKSLHTSLAPLNNWYRRNYSFPYRGLHLSPRKREHKNRGKVEKVAASCNIDLFSVAVWMEADGTTNVLIGTSHFQKIIPLYTVIMHKHTRAQSAHVIASLQCISGVQYIRRLRREFGTTIQWQNVSKPLVQSWNLLLSYFIVPLLRFVLVICLALTVMILIEKLFVGAVSLIVRIFKIKPEKRYKWEPIKQDEEMGTTVYPMVLVQIPMYNEREVVYQHNYYWHCFSYHGNL